MEDLKKGLAIPMYGLHYIDAVKDVNYNEEDALLFRRDYSLEKRQRIFASLEWAMNNKETDFMNIKPYDSNRFSNEEILLYLEKQYSFMKKYNLDSL